MTRKNKLIEALMIVVRALRADRVTYNWTLAHSCNCGLVVQALLGIDKNCLDDRLTSLYEDTDARSWKGLVKEYCPLTGLSKVKIFNELKQAGLEPEDMVHLEYLENPAIIAAAGFQGKPDYKKAADVATYLAAWVKILQQEPYAVDDQRLQKSEAIQRDLLIAVADENYERAAELRNQLVLIA